MVEYKVEVTTGEWVLSETSDYIYVTLIGTDGQSNRTNLDNYGLDFQTGQTSSYSVTSTSSLGRPLLVKLEKEQFLYLPENEWFCSKIVVTTPEGDVILFPCYRWISRGEVVELRGGQATKVFEDELPLMVKHRRQEVELHKQLFKWAEYAKGVPYINSITDTLSLPSEVRFSFSKLGDFIYTKSIALAELNLKGIASSTEHWKTFEDMKEVFWYKRTPIAEYVSEHWKDDEFFGSQYLNGTNPNVIQCCSKLPPNFPVTDKMVQPFLESGSSLARETKEGNIFICDYKKLEGLPTRVVNGEPLPLTPGLCLFYKNPEDKLLPIAIQLGQVPSEHCPIFLPSDSEHDWLLAKLYLRCADFNDYQITHHLLNTHLLAEVFAMATFRNFPVIHPIYKMLTPHFRYTLQINVLARKRLISPDGPLTNGLIDGNGLKELLKRSLSDLTYNSLCLPEDITARGMEFIPHYYYRDDGLKLWKVINSFVKGMVEYYYPSDSEVSRDSELQDWIKEIFVYGFLGNSKSGIPESFHTVSELVKFITMIIFLVSAQHNAVNMGQYDYSSWIANNPLFLNNPPPTTKGRSGMDSILKTLPNVGTSVNNMASVWLLSKKYDDSVPLGTYPDEYFDEASPKKMKKKLQTELSFLSEFIYTRNSKLKLPYIYLNPTHIENSITI
ncbi:hydroperoxide isomerase ALOXE3-like [Osmerus eperlanus]|uniref:hydroperoxide isomerase ALOXE3-like n=1 Tax=Osmerus eperlanus TaxID=29151 RepID=UPI002E142B9E